MVTRFSLLRSHCGDLLITGCAAVSGWFSVYAGWDADVVPDNDGSPDYGVWSSIVEQGNTPLIAYADPSTLDLHLARKTPAGWTIETVDGDATQPNQMPAGGGHLCLRLDRFGNTHLAYASTEGLRWASRNGTGWNYRKVDTTTGISDIALAMDADGHAHIAYFDLSEGGGYGIYYVHWDGSAWDQNHHIVAPSVWVNTYGGTSTFLALDSAGIPHVAFYGRNGQLRLAELNDSPDNSDAQWIISDVPGAMSASYPSIAISTNDHP